MHENPTIPLGLCQCGCGQATKSAASTDPRVGAVKGQPQRFIRGHQCRKSSVEYVVDSATGCWLWQRALAGTGYGSMWNGTKAVPAHRAYYERLVGPIPDGCDLDHVCHNRDLTCPGRATCLHRRCVNPSHMEPVTHRVNVLRGRSSSAQYAARTHCNRGHLFDSQNTFVKKKNGARRCRACHAAGEAERLFRARLLSFPVD